MWKTPPALPPRFPLLPQRPLPLLQSKRPTDSAEEAIFLSHSTKDKPFARKLDAAMSLAGGRVFLDERDIGIGDSIPNRIYAEIESATHVLFVISSNSMNSRWANEELEAAKFRQNQSGSAKVLPVLIDDCDIPSAIRHIKYLDLRDWFDPVSFGRGVNTLLKTLGLGQPSAAQPAIAFYATHYNLINDIEAKLKEFAGYIMGSIAGVWVVDTQPKVRADYVRIALKWEVEDDSLADALSKVSLAVTDAIAQGGSTDLDNIGVMTTLVIVELKSHEKFRGSASTDAYTRYRLLADAARRLGAALGALRQSIEVIHPTLRAELH